MKLFLDFLKQKQQTKEKQRLKTNDGFAEHNQAIAHLQERCKTTPFPGISRTGLPLFQILKALPADCLVNIHDGKNHSTDKYTDPYRHVPAKEALNRLPKSFANWPVHLIQHDTNFGRNPNATKYQPVAVLELYTPDWR